jgi:alpha-ketoglutarate-dependent taurine dioxygenase
MAIAAPVAGALGAELRDIDLRSNDAEVYEELRASINTYQVVFIRQACLDEAAHLQLARRLGTPSVFPLARLRGETEPGFQVINDGPDSPPETDYWHTDVTWTAEPPKYALLAALVVPERGGDTLWASMTAAFDALSPAMQDLLRWQPGDLAIWDERSTNHRSAGDHFPQHRSIRRIEVDGDRPFYRPQSSPWPSPSPLP